MIFDIFIDHVHKKKLKKILIAGELVKSNRIH